MFMQRQWKVYGNTVEMKQFSTTNDIIDFPGNNNNSISFKFKQEIT